MNEAFFYGGLGIVGLSTLWLVWETVRWNTKLRRTGQEVEARVRARHTAVSKVYRGEWYDD